ncbi:sphingomyelin phosphodiesterase 3-like [Diadema setosum]|uniref:sphingomyelin phosphodiesterase 3-like n=1 Tax=Diadema setosum TaxID=31175 RepID=UPI003B3B15DB
MLHQSLFNYSIQEKLYSLGFYLLLPWSWTLNQLIALFLRTSDELQDGDAMPCYERVITLVILVPIMIAIVIISCPLAGLGFALRVILARFRRPYRFSFKSNPYLINIGNRIWTDLTEKRHFKFAFIDSCLMPEAMARMSNLSQVQSRAKQMATQIVNSQLRPNPKIFIHSPSDSELKQSCFYHSPSTSVLLTPQNISHLAGANDNVLKFDTSRSYSSRGSISKDDTLPLRDKDRRRRRDRSPDPPRSPRTSSRTSTGDNSSPQPLRGHARKQRELPQQPTGSSDNEVPDIVPSRGVTSSPSSPESVGSSSTVRVQTSQSHYASSVGPSTPGAGNPRVTITHCPVSFCSESSIRERLGPCEHGISSNFPAHLDFICFQEVFDHRAANQLVHILHNYFSHILYDVGVHSWKVNRFLLNSGLVFASRYPIVDVVFEYFEESQKEDRFVSKGVLMVKVHLGRSEEGHPIVGYVAITQLQAAQEDDLRFAQMDAILKWLNNFHIHSHRLEGLQEVVAFDVLCGNFNFDNMSPADMGDWSHPLFLIYQDPCRMKPGVDKAWTVGTLMRSQRLHDEEVATPENLQRVLENSQKRSTYVEDVEVWEGTEGQFAWSTFDLRNYHGNGKRRVDYVLYSNYNTHMMQECRDYAFVTQLATLTDHIPISMTLTTSLGPSCARVLPSGSSNQPARDEVDHPRRCRLQYETTV